MMSKSLKVANIVSFSVVFIYSVFIIILIVLGAVFECFFKPVSHILFMMIYGILLSCPPLPLGIGLAVLVYLSKNSLLLKNKVFEFTPALILFGVLFEVIYILMYIVVCVFGW